ncbi:MAG: hypothetical protein IKB66_00885 [Clostridia bacterium]|nr:hypothetical protein [Clostridia bacterium]
MEGNKGYKKLVIYLICWFAIMVAGGVLFGIFLPNHAMRFTLNLLTFGISLLMYIIYKDDRIYWLNTIDYDEAKKMTRKQRDKYTFTLFKRFFTFALIMLPITVLFGIFSPLPWGDFVVGIIGLIAVAFSSLLIEH